ncbi:glycosyltransferase [Pedobacter frigiditerrae]|uniref:Glycosyltransferase n=1 Tax=Pedobacter frigiditerrae TaxID=2530452 RepID=A0A4R0N4B1_9SPHI|nr:glycosyltransferase [Pedobacter frigiditerrae]TCC94213.1 glycosyltransferase [Pedobacter frigiditerrae]
MKVLHIVDGLHPKRGGVPTAVLNVTTLFKTAGIEYKILSIGDNPEILPENTIGFNSKQIAGQAYASEGVNWFKQNYTAFDVIYFHSVWNIAILQLYAFALKNNLTYYISPHGSLDPFDIKKKFYFKKILGKLIVNKILLNAKYIFCTSQIETDVIHYFGEKAKNAVVLPLPVDYEEGITGDGVSFRTKYGIDKNQFVFLFLSRINYKKGLNNFIIALSELIKDGQIDSARLSFIIAGDDKNEYADEMRVLLKEYHLENTARFIGLITGQDKADAYVGADAFVLPSKNENFGLAIVEALQSGTPVLISKNVYIYKELFERADLSPGWLCESDLSDLKSCILEALKPHDKDKLKKDSFTVGEQYKTGQLANMYLKFFN